jgi:YHS domain-containing protein/thiol-disulfide isomerase/thioredoxin
MSRHRPYFIFLLCAVPTALDIGPASRFVAAQQVTFGGSTQASGVQWQHDLESAKRAAAQTGRLVLIHFWTPTCPPCLKLEDAVFNQPGVDGALQSQFVPVKLNANEHSDTAQSLGITRLPTDVIMTADGRVLGKLISPPTPAAYVADTTRIARQHTTRLGGGFAQAAAAAPEPSKINTAYAGLQIPANTPAALQAQAVTQNQDRYAAATNPFTASAPTPIAASLTPLAPSTIAATAQVSERQISQFGQTRQVSGAVPFVQSPTPHQIANPYAAPPTAAASLQSSPSVAATSPPPPTDPRALAPNAAPIGFDGYCPVSMRTHWKWVPGNAHYGIVHRGRTYLMAGPAEQQQFWADPDRYSPALSGMDPVLAIDHGQQVPGKREHSIDYNNLFYMFASEATLQQFTSTPERYAVAVRQAMGIQRGRLVR